MLEIENLKIRFISSEYCSICFQHWTACNCTATLDHINK